jgi:Na+-transporting NADH:ubiquinone oxidoreductase subunit D
MADDAARSCATCCPSPGLLCGKGGATLKDGVWSQNPVSIQILGICSALAVTNRFENSLVMGAALVFVIAMSNLFVSILRTATPRRIRMIAEVAVIATFVILFDQFLKAYYWGMSKQLGPYVGLIITNCIVMGRAEAFALQNPPLLSVVDGIANGLGYAAVLAIIGFFRELLGNGTVFGREVLSGEWYEPNQLMILAPGAFIALGLLIAGFNAVRKAPEGEEQP